MNFLNSASNSAFSSISNKYLLNKENCIEINGKKYTVVKRKNILTIPDNFSETTVVINNEEIPAFYNEITN